MGDTLPEDTGDRCPAHMGDTDMSGCGTGLSHHTRTTREVRAALADLSSHPSGHRWKVPRCLRQRGGLVRCLSVSNRGEA